MTMTTDPRRELVQSLGAFARDPYGFVMFAYPWGEPGTPLEMERPEDWQVEALQAIGRGINPASVMRYAVSSGHGIGKSAFFSWLIHWSLATHPYTRLRATAQTGTQLASVLWAELAKWHRLFIARDLFRWSPTSYVWAADPANWRADAVTWSDNNSSGFAGLHNAGRRTVILMDEASAIPGEIYDTAEGALSDDNTERLIVVAGNPTEPSGRFFDVFHKLKGQWVTRFVDSRSVRRTDKEKINQLIETWGIDSNVVKVRVLGQFPSESANQLIPFGLVQAAMSRAPVEDLGAPVILGVDPSSGQGECESVAVLRIGRYVNPSMVWRWKQHASMMELAHRVAEIIDRQRPDAVYVDGCAYGHTLVQMLESMGHVAQAVHAGGGSSDKRYANKRAQNWCALKEDLATGVFSLPDDPELLQQLTMVPYGFDKNGAILLEKKENLPYSPDIADALAITYSYPVVRRDMRVHQQYYQPINYMDEATYG
jgi:hypothetical protein